jgi:predicted MFS family arabinose efflux permease
VSDWQGFWRKGGSLLVPPGLDSREQRLVLLHLLSALLTGIAMGVLTIADTILTKTLGGSAMAVTILSILTGLGFLATLFWGGAMRNRRKAPYILAAGIVGRLGMALAGIWQHAAWFIFVVGLGWLGQALIVTAQVTVIQRAYRVEHRNQLFGLSVSVATLMRLLATVATGRILDWNEQAYGFVFAVAGIAGLAGAFLLTRMEGAVDGAGEKPLPLGFYQPPEEPGLVAGARSMHRSAREVLRVLRDDRRFRQFEANFFLYGMAFLALLPIVPLFLVHDLGLDYTRIGMAKGLLGQTGLILLAPILGRSMESLKPVRFCARIFTVLSLYPLLLLGAGIAPLALQVPLVYSAFAFFGIAMAGVNVAWSLSSIHFAGDEDPSTYQAVHSFLVGIRGVGAPLVGYLIISVSSNLHGFVVCAALFLSAALLMARMSRSEAARAAAGDGSAETSTKTPPGICAACPRPAEED